MIQNKLLLPLNREEDDTKQAPSPLRGEGWDEGNML
jgi:hypothetical protein